MRLLLSFIFLLWAGEEAAAFQKPIEQDYRDIEFQIAIVRSATMAIEMREVALRKSGSNKVALKAEIAGLMQKQKNAGEQAIWLTMRGYGIIPFADNAPILDEGTSFLVSPELGKKIKWLPIFDDSGPKADQDASGKFRGVRKSNIRRAGNTASDGISRLFPAAFSSPVELASYIIHEQKHFTQITTEEKGVKKTIAENEVEAYEEELKLLNDPDNVLGYSEDMKEKQRDRITILLEGENGKDGFKAIAKQERAAAKRRGYALPERSLLSHSEDDIARLVQQAKDQITIAQRDHDDRLKYQWIELSKQACRARGSVMQSDLDVLPRLHKRDPYDPVKTLTGNCYDRVYWNLYHGATAEEINKIAAPLVAPNPHPPLVTRPVEAIASVTFGQILNDIWLIADTACKYRGHIPPVRDFYVPRRSYALLPGDDDAAAALQARLGKCEGHVFGRIYNALRDERGGEITEQWMVDTVASTPGAPPPPTTPGSGYVSPPQGGGGYVSPPQGGGGTNPCERGGDPFACQPPHPK